MIEMWWLTLEDADGIIFLSFFSKAPIITCWTCWTWVYAWVQGSLWNVMIDFGGCRWHHFSFLFFEGTNNLLNLSLRMGTRLAGMMTVVSLKTYWTGVFLIQTSYGSVQAASVEISSSALGSSFSFFLSQNYGNGTIQVVVINQIARYGIKILLLIDENMGTAATCTIIVGSM